MGERLLITVDMGQNTTLFFISMIPTWVGPVTSKCRWEGCYGTVEGGLGRDLCDPSFSSNCGTSASLSSSYMRVDWSDHSRASLALSFYKSRCAGRCSTENRCNLGGHTVWNPWHSFTISLSGICCTCGVSLSWEEQQEVVILLLLLFSYHRQ